MKNLFTWIKNKFKKRESPIYDDYGIITYNENAIRNGIEDNANKIILRFKYDYGINKMNLHKVYGYSDSLLKSLRNVMKIPVYDRTLKDEKYPVYENINLDEISYIK